MGAKFARLWSPLKARFGSPRSRVVELPGEEPIDIAPIISPLRLDILLRRDWFDFRASQRERFDADFAALLEASLRHPYGTWFRVVVAGSVHPEYLASETRFLREFASRLRRSVALQDSFEANRLVASKPIVLKSGEQVHPTASGKRIASELYAGNGCHRLALLLRAGRKRLEPGEYVVRRALEYTPRDNTGRLLEALGMHADDYYRFVSMAYGEGEGEGVSRESLLERVRSKEPERLAELESILLADEPHLVNDACP
jgi:hypothetical protein